jgi:hypothetical protein
MKRLLCCLLLAALAGPVRADIVVAEGEMFQPQDTKGWKVTHQDDTYGSHSYGGMWMTHGGCLGAPADSVGALATQTVTIPKADKYRVWSKYQAPPYFNYLNKVEIVQQGKTVFSHIYGKKGTDRLWSFSGTSDELWWPWGVDHDAAEAPKDLVALQAGPAEIRLLTVANPKPAGDRFVDFILLTTNPKDEYQGYKPYAVGSPFALEALAATKLYLRFKNSTDKPAQLTVTRNGHFQPQYGGATAKYPDQPVAPGQWSAWVNVGPFCRLVHDEGLFLKLPSAAKFAVQFARDEQGKDLVGDFTIADGGSAVVPMDVTWNKKARVKPAEEHARHIMELAKTWRKANGGKKPGKVLFYGAFSGPEPWIMDLKAALGYNTLLPDKYEHVQRDGMYTHAHNPAEIEAAAKTIKDKSKFRIMSFGDEISLGEINYKDVKLQEKFRAWLKMKGVTAQELGVAPDQAVLTPTGDPRLVWYSIKFNEEERFAFYRAMTELTKKLLGPEVLTGANYSPHHLILYYGPIYQWVDIFKYNGMSMFWAEDYIFSVPEVPQIISFMYAQMRCAIKYHHQPIHCYVMPHSPGQEPDFFRRNVLLSVGYGAAHIDNFWIAPAENFTENYVSWHYPKMFQAIHEAIYDTAEVEQIQHGGTVRPAKVALVTGRATDFNESRLNIDKNADPFAKQCKNAPAQINQGLCRKDQQMLYLALKHAQHAVDAITEEDINAGALQDYEVVYFAGEWIDSAAAKKLADWVKAGGILYASAGLGHKNQFGAPESALLDLLGLKEAKLTKSLILARTLLELPLVEAADTITLDGEKIPAVGMRQQLVPGTAKVLGTWADGSAAVTVSAVGKGKAFAVGTCAGMAWMKTALKVTPWARGGKHMLYNPVDFAPAATKLVRLGVNARKVVQAAVCANPVVEAIVLDNKNGTLVTLVNWTNTPLKNLQVQVRLDKVPAQVRSVRWQKGLTSSFANGVLTFTVDLEDADYIMLPK